MEITRTVALSFRTNVDKKVGCLLSAEIAKKTFQGLTLQTEVQLNQLLIGETECENLNDIQRGYHEYKYDKRM